jgi:hypothetical protein
MSASLNRLIPPGCFLMTPTLYPLVQGPHLTPLAPDAPACVAKRSVLGHDAGEALLVHPGFDAAPALHALCAQAALEHPQAWSWDAGEARATRLGWAVSVQGRLRAIEGAHAATGEVLAALPTEWRLAGLVSLAFEEDLAVLDGTSGRVPWMAVCLPSLWVPREKIGLHFTAIHAPVADNTLLMQQAARRIDQVTQGGAHERFVWTLTSHALLDAHPVRAARSPWPAHLSPQALMQCTSFRHERQTLLPLPSSRQAVFTIRVWAQPLPEALDTLPGLAERLHHALETMSETVLAYRGLTPARGMLLEGLAMAAGIPHGPGVDVKGAA